MNELTPIILFLILAWSAFQLLRPPRVFQIIVGGRLLEMTPRMALFVPDPGPLVIETQVVQVPLGGAFFRMDSKGNLRMAATSN